MSSLNVLLPIRNPNLDWLRETLASLTTQEFQDFRLVAVLHPDDQDVEEIVRSFGMRTTIARAPRRGNLSDALNVGLEFCTAMFTARIDQDDRAHSSRFRLQVEALLEDNTCVAIGSAARLIDSEGSDIGSRELPTTYRSCLAQMRWKSSLMHPTAMYRTRVVKEAGGYLAVAQNVEDYELWLRILCIGEIRSLPQKLLDYRMHAGQMTQIRKISSDAIESVSVARRNLAVARGESLRMAEFRQLVWSTRQKLRAKTRQLD